MSMRKRQKRGAAAKTQQQQRQAAQAQVQQLAQVLNPAVYQELLGNVGALAQSSLTLNGLDMLQNTVESMQQQHQQEGSIFSLKLKHDDLRCPFVNVWFPVQLFVIDSNNCMKRGWDLPVHVQVFYENGSLVTDQEVLMIKCGDNTFPASATMDAKAPPLRIGALGQVNVELYIQQVSMVHENRKFQVTFSCPQAASDALSLGSTVMPATTPVMNVIRHRLRINSQPPRNWYKDEGGRDKAMTINATLCDADGNAVHNREVPLTVTLVYQDGHNIVKNQSILKLTPDTVPKVDQTGQCCLKYRIEEVSKNHQKQAFCLRIEPDVAFSPANNDISSDMSTAVTVLSKRNRRPRKNKDKDTSSFPKSTQPDLQTISNQVDGTAISSMVTDNPALHGVLSWCKFVFEGMQKLEWQHVGYEDIRGRQSFLYRCPGCWAYRGEIGAAQHQPSCTIFRSIMEYETTCWGNIQEISKQLSAVSSLTQGGVSADMLKMMGGLNNYRNSNAAATAAFAAAAAGGGGSGGVGLSVELPEIPTTDDGLPPLMPSLGTKMSALGDFGLPSLSQTYTEGMPYMMDGNTTRQLSFSNFGAYQYQPATDFGMDSNMLAEQDVWSVLVQMNSDYGFPSFSQNNVIVAFYKPAEENTGLLFYRVADTPITEQQKQELTNNFLSLGQQNDKRIVTRANCVTLEKMKEIVLLEWYQQQADTFTH